MYLLYLMIYLVICWVMSVTLTVFLERGLSELTTETLLQPATR
jgi:hypothetical protein